MTFLSPSRPSWLIPAPAPAHASAPSPAAPALSWAERLRRRTWDRRYQQLAELVADPTSVDVTADERVIDQNLTIALGSTALAGAGYLFFSPLLLLSLPGILYTCLPIYTAAYRSLAQERKIGVDVLYAITQSFVLGSGLLFPAGMGTINFMLSHKMLAAAKERFRQQVAQLFGDMPVQVHLLVDGQEIETHLERLDAGDVVVVYPGEVMPVDGMIVHGTASIGEEILTGEFNAAEKGVDDPVYTGTLLHAGRIQVQVQEAGANTVAARIGQILEQISDFKSDKPLRSEVFTDRSVLPWAIASGLAVPFVGPIAAVAAMDAHPHRRLTITTSLSLLNFVSEAAAQGILIKDGRSLELLQGVDTVIFDKTGTLTLDRPHIGQVHTFHGYSEFQVLAYAAAAEAHQSHPIAQAVQEAARSLPDFLTDSLPDINDARYETGNGLTVTIEGKTVRVGSVRFIQQLGIAISEDGQGLIDQALAIGHSVVLVAVDAQIVGVLELHATLRPEVKALVSALQERGLSLAILSGDQAAPTRHLAERLGIKTFWAETLPEEKAKLVAQLQAEGRSICFVGDGINDTVALKQAHVSVSLRGAALAATDTAHIVLMQQNLSQLSVLFDLADGQRRNATATGLAILGPAAISIAGALFAGTTLAFTEFMNLASFPLSAGVAMWPRIKQEAVSLLQVQKGESAQMDKDQMTRRPVLRVPSTA